MPHVRAGPGCRSLPDFLATFGPSIRCQRARRNGAPALELVQDAAAGRRDPLGARLSGAAGRRARRARRHAPRRGRAARDARGPRGRRGGDRLRGRDRGCYRSLPFAQNAGLLALALAHAGRSVVNLIRARHAPPRAPPRSSRARGTPRPIWCTRAGPRARVRGRGADAARRHAHRARRALARDPALRAARATRRRARVCLTNNVRTSAVASLTNARSTRCGAGPAITLTDDPAVCDLLLARYALAAAPWVARRRSPDLARRSGRSLVGAPRRPRARGSVIQTGTQEIETMNWAELLLLLAVAGVCGSIGPNIGGFARRLPVSIAPTHRRAAGVDQPQAQAAEILVLQVGSGASHRVVDHARTVRAVLGLLSRGARTERRRGPESRAARRATTPFTPRCPGADALRRRRVEEAALRHGDRPQRCCCASRPARATAATAIPGRAVPRALRLAAGQRPHVGQGAYVFRRRAGARAVVRGRLPAS